MAATAALGRFAAGQQGQQPDREKADGDNDLPDMETAAGSHCIAFGTGNV
jgi:hypothetical protein